VTTFSHIGVCVSDMEKSCRFYCDGLGFELAEKHSVGPEFGRLMEIEGVKVDSQFVRREGMAIELLHFLEPGFEGDGARRAINRLGITHLSFRVDDVDTVASKLVSLGGVVLRDSRTTFDLGEQKLDFVYCTDPDGVRIELMKLPG
jgi:catechol 2,3-dioxygenase-like lactoylglutathione lyase family enzyme